MNIFQRPTRWKLEKNLAGRPKFGTESAPHINALEVMIKKKNIKVKRKKQKISVKKNRLVCAKGCKRKSNALRIDAMGIIKWILGVLSAFLQKLLVLGRGDRVNKELTGVYRLLVWV